MADTDPRRQKLPAWARAEMERLQRDLDAAREQLTTTLDADTANVVRVDYTNGDQGLPDATYRFKFDRQYIDVQRRSDGELDVTARGGLLVVRPRLANAVRLSVSDED